MEDLDVSIAKTARNSVLKEFRGFSFASWLHCYNLQPFFNGTVCSVAILPKIGISNSP